MATQNNQVNLNVKELKRFLEHIITNNRVLQQKGKNMVSTEIVGESGGGKTSTVIQLGKSLNLPVVKLNLAQIEDLGDLVGYPVRQFQLCKAGELPAAVEPVTTTAIKKKEMVMVPAKVKRIEKYSETEYTIEKVKKQVLRNGKMVMEEIDQKIPKVVEKEREVEEDGFVEQEMEVESDVSVAPPVVIEAATGDCQWVDEQAVQEYLRQNYTFTGKKRMSYCPPEWIAGKEAGGILLLDDWNRAD